MCNRNLIFLISLPKHMLWVLKRTVSMSSKSPVLFKVVVMVSLCLWTTCLTGQNSIVALLSPVSILLKSKLIKPDALLKVLVMASSCLWTTCLTWQNSIVAFLLPISILLKCKYLNWWYQWARIYKIWYVWTGEQPKLRLVSGFTQSGQSLCCSLNHRK